VDVAPERRNLEDCVNSHHDTVWRGRVAQLLANTDHFARDEDWFPAQVVAAALNWLKRNREQRCSLLWIDCFDPHEPWGG